MGEKSTVVCQSRLGGGGRRIAYQAHGRLCLTICAYRGPLALQGAYLWTLKQNIDREFMDLYRPVPAPTGMTVTVEEAQRREAEAALVGPSLPFQGLNH